ncbi:hypothetical protein KAT36_03525 [Candidatus Pacearchaeota archaeon]|nr:hypothetical protein [Candidatus Pacearchaeota archaeon]
MKKCGGALLIIGIVILVLLIGIVGTGFYLYNFHVFKEVRICIGDATNTMMPCEITQDCIDMEKAIGFDIDLEGAPNFVQDNFQKVFDEVIYCDRTCFIRSIRGFNYKTQEIEMLDSCLDSEVEFVVEIRGKEGLEVWEWMRKGER